MVRAVPRRLLQAAICVLLVLTATFFLVHLAPGDPYSDLLENPAVSPEAAARFREAQGLDRPLAEQYGRYLLNLLRGDFGISISQSQPVARAIISRLPNTLLLMSTALILSFVIGTAIGVIQAVRRGRASDRALSTASLFVYSMPDFWLASMAALVFTFWMRVFPRGGAYDQVMYHMLSPLGKVLDRLEHLALPALTLGILNAAIIARYQRGAMRDALSSDYVKLAAAKGASRARVVLKHAWRNSLGATISLFGLSLPFMFGGSVFIERAFSWPGMGLLTITALQQRDHMLVVGIAIVMSVLVSIGSLVADLLHEMVDPRVRAPASA